MTGHLTLSSMPFQAPRRGGWTMYVDSAVVFIPAGVRHAFKRRPPG